MILPSNIDPMGSAISDYHKNGKASKLWVHSDITDKHEIPVPYLFRTYNEMPNIEQVALNKCKGNILDIGAATGSHSLWLQEKGMSVTAIDISELAVETINNRGVKTTLAVDFFEFPPKQKFDTLLLLMNGIGIAGSINGLKEFFSKCKELLKTNGQILLDSSDLNYMFDDEDEKPMDKYYGEVRYVMNYRDIISDPFNWLFIDYSTLKTEAFKYAFQCEKISEGEHFDYLARLTMK
jgi:SAM-dependent methyltransferase